MTDIKKTVGLATMEKFDNRKFNSVGSSRIRMRWLLPHWLEAEEFIIGKEYEVLVFQKVYWGNMMKAFKGIKILDLCDPDWLEKKPVFKFVDMCDAVTTSTEALAEYIRKMRSKAFVQCVPDRILLAEAKPIKKKHEGNLKHLIWFGYHHNTHYLINTFDELIKRKIKLTIVSNQPYEPPLAYRGKIEIENIPYNYDTINVETIKADAVLMPEPRGDERGKYKSNNKTLQAWAVGMPCIKVPEDLDRFNSAEARNKEKEKRLAEIKKDWDVRLSVKEMREIIEKCKKKV